MFVRVPVTFTLHDMLSGHSANLSNEELGMLQRSTHVGVIHHGLEFRLTGEPYYEHPLSVSEIIRQVGGGVEEQSVARMHDIFESLAGREEDLSRTRDEMERFFSPRIIFLVDALTKKDGVDYWKQLLVANSDDFWVLIIKMADRLHNLETIVGFGVSKQEEYLEETHGPFLDTCRKGLGQAKGDSSDLVPIYEGMIDQLMTTAQSKLEYVRQKLKSSP